MRSLFFKIFGIFWLAQSLIFIITTGLIIRQHFPTGGSAFEALNAHLLHDATEAAAAYRQGGCAAFALLPQPVGALLFDAAGRPLCHTNGAPDLGSLEAHLPNRILSDTIGGRFVWLVPVRSAQGDLVYAWLQPPSQHQPPPAWHQMLRFANPQMPVAIAIGGLTTFFLTLLFTRPLVRLRAATRSLAEGNLQVRVEESARSRAGKQVDEFEGLVHDFNHMAGRLESLVGAQKLLLRDVSHELRSPLARLSVALELVREDAGPAFEEHFSRIERETGKLNSLIGELLTLSSLDTRDDVASFKAVSLNKLCASLLPDAEFEAQQRPCTVRLVEEGEYTVRGDVNLLHRAMENVVRNSMRYTRPGTEVTLRLAGARREQRSFAVFQVDDFGPGIPEAELDKIFLPFYRIDRARSSSTGGFGVGLAIVERAVRLHGGAVQAVNREGGGASIRIELPLQAM
jgi:two-component system, OmpR family, sensor histidine kinase CpxA